MNVKIFSLSFLLSPLLLVSAFAMYKEPTASGGVKCSYSTAFGEESAGQDEVKPHVKEFLLGKGKDELGNFSPLSNGIIDSIFSDVDPRTTMLINSTFYTLATGYKRERMFLIGLGSNKQPDFSEVFFSSHTSGSCLYTSKTDQRDSFVVILDPYDKGEFDRIPSVFWYTYLKYLEINQNDIVMTVLESLPHANIKSLLFTHESINDKQIIQLGKILKKTKLTEVLLSTADIKDPASLITFCSSVGGTKLRSLELPAGIGSTLQEAINSLQGVTLDTLIVENCEEGVVDFKQLGEGVNKLSIGHLNLCHTIGDLGQATSFLTGLLNQPTDLNNRNLKTIALKSAYFSDIERQSIDQLITNFKSTLKISYEEDFIRS